ncbi:polysaccharide biosynthesis/export family protein [Botryobacter ruber]|uniref:polysaccharide biosynthesis/export family protein n=1 Tax=Botryobacter ruber TaxID=2171629 RepID=UPI000E0CBD60|nr:polysaccharide biosynthesis/export family protein [Botryobacter ruber]
MRNALSVLCFLAGILIFGSCVPQKKVLLLQENPNVENQGKADKLLKTIPLQKRVYTLKPGDVLSLQVQSTTPEELNFLAAPPATFGATDPVLSGYTLDEEGNMLLPVVGKLSLLNLSMPEARIKIAEALKPYLADPTVNLRLLTFRFTVLGEVGAQGQYTTLQDDLNVLDALSYAGGFTPFSNRGNIRLIRYEEGHAKIYAISLLDNEIIGKQNFFMMPNDLLIVDPLPAKSIKDNWVGSLTIGLSVISTLIIILTRLNR